MPKPLAELFADFPARERTLLPGEFLFHRGNPVRTVYWIDEGLVHLQRFTRDGSAAVMQRADAGSLLAEASIFSDSYHCDAIAVEAVRARRFFVADVRRALDERAGFAAAFAQHLAQELIRMRSRTEIAALRTVQARLDAWLALHDYKLPERGKRVDLAREIGVAPEALYRELARRRREGHLAPGG